MQDIFMRTTTNLDKLWIKSKMDISHQKAPNYFMMLSTVYYVTMEISMITSRKIQTIHLLLFFSYMLLADYDGYIKCQDRVNALFKVRFFSWNCFLKMIIDLF
jgi:hypothetical protein